MEEVLITSDDSDIGFVDINVTYHDNVKNKTRFFTVCPGNK